MIDTLKFILLTTIIFCCLLMERYSAEKDITKQLTIEGRTHFVFLDDIKVTNVEKIEEVR